MSICSMTLARTSRQSSMMASWNTMPTSVCGLSTRLPPTVIVPGGIGRKPRHHLEDGGLAAAARADDGDKLGLLDLEIDVGAGFDRPALGLVFLADVLQPDVGFAHTPAVPLGKKRAASPPLTAKRPPLALLLFRRRVRRGREVLVGVVLAHVRLRRHARRISAGDPGFPANPPWPTTSAAFLRCAWCG